MNGTVALVSVLGTAVGLAVVLLATYFHLGNALIAVGGVVVLAAVGMMTVAIAALDGEGGEHGGH
ncbi:hypothetical protein [Halomarina oriensis]|uniref:Major facilitator superfamily (MFS) profile domain-containing protein n=1 Tax=Halomarina oriensis TaxID=671145 RepID=A0A6B0GUY0_9EURY|nr:hypothetical protein [Halomarina oriensis]MWG35955.1 hypothetical protein [Halomarina oriensis]